jgi:hypothetical protein
VRALKRRAVRARPPVPPTRSAADDSRRQGPRGRTVFITTPTRAADDETTTCWSTGRCEASGRCAAPSSIPNRACPPSLVDLCFARG